ncbi:cell division protein ZapE [Shewanella sp. CG12_big_fil_rev_8_21_14_0_65_47_15]|uniref:cell division protein ZapE n=1 Tax=Shewanella sp. CG12_big_fil_rev_8_21_14_0_65_47_15 TaxID=1975537 RepID=UPI000CA8D339|nr:cell division protein ZapE [Shewanella sp. CG12_big_fil_rev_8_21_14_0_65_47_15]PIW62115.1 MAG: cell division protein ZapE [Shewanella sp. CG12_big_fil_rev_8_21_14_0_65_47_15]
MAHSNSASSQSITPMMTPLEVYRAKVSENLLDDPAQQQAVLALDMLFKQLMPQPYSARLSHSQSIKGLYLWGDVGRGKTFLMDLFFDCLPSEGKLRLHFHRFMARIHQALREHSGQRNPLKLIANNLAKECKVLCFDEFFVSDIGDAMILAGLFEQLFEQGVVLVATSNIPIDRLYENGLARHKFLPCIALLQKHTQMLHLNGSQDHRMHTLADGVSEEALASTSQNIAPIDVLDFDSIFNKLTPNAPSIGQSHIRICQRNIPIIRATLNTQQPSVAWFDFNALCDGPRSQLDYIEIASKFNILMLSNVPRLGGEVKGWIRARGTEDGTGENQAETTGERKLSYAANDDPARRFISLIDELYDQNVILYLSCEVPLKELYQGGALSFEFRRTYSRLIEMSRSA